MKQSVNRRKFIRSTSIGAAGIFAAKNAHAGIHINTSSRENQIIYRTLGKTGIKLPIVNLGVMRVDNPNLVRAALDAGMVHLDTAHKYQNGRNEEMLGELLKDYPRDSFVISTKVPDSENETTEGFLKKLDISLNRLNLDHVDILYLHSTDSRELTLNETYLKALEKAKKTGKTKFVGVTTHRNEPEVIRAAIESQFYDVVLTAYNYRMEHLTDVKKAISEAAQAGIGIIAMKTMAGVYLDKARTKKVNTKAALKWVLQDENVHTSIPGCTAFDQLEENIEVAQNLEFTGAEKQDLEKTSKDLSMFCTGCGDCEKQCPYNVPVPELMRAYMYTYGYRDLTLGKQVISDLNVSDDICKHCDECFIHCRSGFNVAEKNRDIIRLKHIPDDLLV